MDWGHLFPGIQKIILIDGTHGHVLFQKSHICDAAERTVVVLPPGRDLVESTVLKYYCSMTAITSEMTEVVHDAPDIAKIGSHQGKLAIARRESENFATHDTDLTGPL